MELFDCCYRVSVKALILDESRTRFLIIREVSGVWELPGGGIEHGVDAREELRREIQEEMGLEVTEVAKSPSYFLTCKNPKGTPTSNVPYEALLRDMQFTPSKECVELRFVSSADVRNLHTTENVQKLADIFDPGRHA